MKDPNKSGFTTGYSLVIRNAGLNLAGKALPAIVAVFAIPYIVHGLGLDQYAILSLALTLVAYFSLFDLGLGMAATKFVAGALGRGDEECVPTLIWTTLLITCGLGLAAGVVMFYLSPMLAIRLLKIPLLLKGEALAAFRMMSTAVPFMLIGSGWRGVLEAKQRYDLINLASVPISIANYAIPVVALYFGVGLVPIVAYVVISRAISCLTYFFLCLRVYPGLGRGIRISFRDLKPVLVFGGWLAISNLAWPVLLYLDRLFIGVLLPIKFLAFYAAPCDAITRLWVLPASWIALFPAYSAVGAGKHEELANLWARGLKHLAVLMGPVVIVVVFFARTILRLWLGPQFAVESTAVFQILALGVFVNSLANVPDLLIKALGRSDIIAKLHVAELPLYGLLLYVTVREWGILGAAIAWAARAFGEAVVVFAISRRLVPPTGAAIVRVGVLRAAVTLSALFLVMWIAAEFLRGNAMIFFGASCLVVVGLAMWRCVLDRDDRKFLRAALNLKAA